MRQQIVSVVPEGGSFFEVATPAGVWDPARLRETDLAIDFTACGVGTTSVDLAGGITLSGLGRLRDHVADADVVIVPTWPIESTPVPDDLVDALVTASENGARLVGLCLGAFAVAATGLLDGRSAVTHWRHRARFEALHPDVRFEPDTLYVDHGQLVTSAGSAAAMDCCLHLIRDDHGAEAAATVARSLVTAPHRSGTQSQFASAPPIPSGPDPIAQALSQAAQDIGAVADVGALAALAAVGRRSLERHLQDRLGVTPKEWIDEQRLLTACRLLEQPDISIEQVAQRAGYGSTPSLRRAFNSRRGTTPTRYRAMFAPPTGGVGDGG